jgi:hypothetical protein
MASNCSPSDSTYTISNGTSPSSLFLHEFDSEAFEVGPIFQYQNTRDASVSARSDNVEPCVSKFPGDPPDPAKTDFSGGRKVSWGKRTSAPPWAMPLATSKELLSTSAYLNRLDVSPADFGQLRDKDENEAANSIAKATISILNIFNDATADWDIEKCLMNPLPVSTDCLKF